MKLFYPFLCFGFSLALTTNVFASNLMNSTTASIANKWRQRLLKNKPSKTETKSPGGIYTNLFKCIENLQDVQRNWEFRDFQKQQILQYYPKLYWFLYNRTANRLVADRDVRKISKRIIVAPVSEQDGTHTGLVILTENGSYFAAIEQSFLNDSFRNNLEHYGVEIALPGKKPFKVGVRQIDLVLNARKNSANKDVAKAASKGIAVSANAFFVLWPNSREIQRLQSFNQVKAKKLEKLPDTMLQSLNNDVINLINVELKGATEGVMARILDFTTKIQEAKRGVNYVKENAILAKEKEKLENATSDYNSIARSFSDQMNTINSKFAGQVDKIIQEMKELTKKYEEAKNRVSIQTESYRKMVQQYKLSRQIITSASAVFKKLRDVRKRSWMETELALKTCGKFPSFRKTTLDQLKKFQSIQEVIDRKQF